MANHSGVLDFEIIGFPGLNPKFEILVSSVLFSVYIMSLVANGTVIILTVNKKNLHQPMYAFIGNLALSDLLFDTITLPKIIAKYWCGDGLISFPGCITQLFFVHFFGIVDSFIIMLMALDRYVAICKPLIYCSIMTNKVTAILCYIFWFLAAVLNFYNPYMIAQFNFCGNTIKNCYCVSIVMYSLSCTDISTVLQVSFTIAMFVLLVPLSFIIASYIIIIKTIYSSSRSDSWQKAFYTCTTHLLVISLYYLPRVSVYLCNLFRVAINADLNILILCLYTYIPHLASPIIYCLRTEEILKTLHRFTKRENYFRGKLKPRVGFTRQVAAF
ncbi:olfactory receptor 6C65-like [Pelobates fuscus]|uniref:olfactory receptor 6C65-like n=1 Tax=Pelobates fuscus TaxID=191477 RepID=UPI002FE4F774